MVQRSIALLAWDSDCDRRRDRIREAVLAFGLGGQFSALECGLTAAERRELWHRVCALSDPLADRLLLLRLDPRLATICLGTARPATLQTFHYFG